MRCEPLTPLMPLLDQGWAQPETREVLARLLKATAEATLLLQLEHTKRVAGAGLAPTRAEVQGRIPQALWGLRCEAAPTHLLLVRLHIRSGTPAQRPPGEQGCLRFSASELGSGGPFC